MRGVVFLGNGELAVRSFPDPIPGPGEAVVRIRSSGMCGSDLHPYRAPRPQTTIGGHEPCGDVAELGPGVSGPPIGTRVMVHHYSGCGVCKYCRIGYEQLCTEGHVTYGFGAHGGFAEAMLVPVRTLIPLPDQLSYEAGAAIACGTGTAYMALRKLDVSGRDVLAVFGQGPVGLSATILAKAMGARVIAVDVSETRLALARDLGANVTINSTLVDPVAAIVEQTRAEGADATMDCTGHPVARAQMVRSARVWGRACFVGEGGTVTLEPSPDIIHKHLTIYGSWTFSTVGLAECAEFIVDREVAIDRLITRRYALDQASEAFLAFSGGSPGKSVFRL